MKKRKQGQVTLFIVIGIIILLLIGLGLYYRTSLTKSFSNVASIGLSDEEEETRTVIQSCFDEALQTGLLLAAHQSGHVFLTSNYLILQGVFVPYAYDAGKNSAPNVQDTTKELQTFLNQEVTRCSKNTNAQFETAISSVRINNNEATARLTYPFIVTTNGKTVRNNSPYTTSADTELITYLTFMQAVVTSVAQNPQEIPIGLLLAQNNFETNTITTSDSVLYTLRSLDTNQTYFFATRTGETE